MTGPWWFVAGWFFGAAAGIGACRWAFRRVIDKARAVAMAKVSRVFAETMAQLYPDVPVTWEAMVEQETYDENPTFAKEYEATWCEPERKDVN